MPKTLLPRDDFAALSTSKRSSCDWIVGLDEAGAGCLAGPLYVGAFAVPKNAFFLGLEKLAEPVTDSKKLSAVQREKSFAFLQTLEGATAYVKEVSVSVVEEKNIYWARMETFLDFVIQLEEIYSSRVLFLVDGPRLHVSPKQLSNPAFRTQWTKLEQRVLAFPKADGTYFSVAAASLVAKVNRDRLMKELDGQDPRYNWSSNKGYGTPDHLELISKHGLSVQHRPSFCKNISLDRASL